MGVLGGVEKSKTVLTNLVTIDNRDTAQNLRVSDSRIPIAKTWTYDGNVRITLTE